MENMNTKSSVVEIHFQSLSIISEYIHHGFESLDRFHARDACCVSVENNVSKTAIDPTDFLAPGQFVVLYSAARKPGKIQYCIPINVGLRSSDFVE